MMKPRALRWALFRMMSYSIVAINLLSCGTFLYVIAPYTSYFFFNDLRFWKYLHFYHRYTIFSLVYIYRLVRYKNELVKTVLPLTSPPMDHPDPALFRISDNWKLPADSCGDCNNCCTYIVRCCFLDESQRKCVSYGSLFWKFFNCGRFPNTKDMLRYCDCRKYEAV
jgi:hypothetical protein